MIKPHPNIMLFGARVNDWTPSQILLIVEYFMLQKNRFAPYSLPESDPDHMGTPRVKMVEKELVRLAGLRRSGP